MKKIFLWVQKFENENAMKIAHEKIRSEKIISNICMIKGTVYLIKSKVITGM